MADIHSPLSAQDIAAEEVRRTLRREKNQRQHPLHHFAGRRHPDALPVGMDVLSVVQTEP
ncbi:hypothetical protein DZS_01150 [Dickeya ananatis]